MTIQRFILLISFTSLVTYTAPSQRQHPGMILPRENNFFAATFSGPSLEEGKSRLIILYRLPRTFFVFTRDPESVDQNASVAGCEINLEIRDTTGEPVVHKLVKRTFRSSDETDRQSDSLSFTGGLAFDVPPGRYAVRYEVTDVESKRAHRDDSLIVKVKSFPRDSLALSDIMFVSPNVDSSSGRMIALNYGKTLPFGARAKAFFQIASTAAPENIHIGYTIVRHGPEHAAGEHPSPEYSASELADRDTVPPLLLHPAKALMPEEHTEYLTRGTSLGAVYDCTIDLHLDTLQQGNYILEVHAGDGSTRRSTEEHFTIRWIGMPSSLRSLSGAIAAMKYILTDSAYDDLTSGSEEHQKELFEAYWKKHDATPATAFNEVMAEFYTRVDHAVTAFGTLRDQNGLRSDRGKVYVLYGAPTRVERRLAPSSSPQEIWYYERLKKKAVFLDPGRAGDYKLLSMENL